MAILVDEQVSQGESELGVLDIPITSTPELFGTLGLDTSSAGPNLRIEFNYTLQYSFVRTASVLISVYRGEGIDAVLVYQTEQTIPAPSSKGNHTVYRVPITATGVDYLPPNTDFIVYQAFVSTPEHCKHAKLKRIGPESFAARAYSD
ncbi:hypothetical protein [Paenibacillus aquistagni]|uniref:hypothetical protein n=1 Tax=Paenibacillus aquistagni TaxID=1852522 RepID=UPI00145B4CE3|nr:hypothetical protein [Paenibacillus aquistagni]NMM53623.1 hypothetical protein [Paenibacillus aquistagni]